MKWPRPSLGVKLPLLVMLATVVTATVGATVAIVVGQSAVRAETLAAQRDLARLYAGAIQFYVASARAALETTASSALALHLGSDRDVARALLRHAAVFEHVMLLASDGHVQMLEPRGLERELSHEDLSFHAWYRELMAGRRTVVSDLHVSPATQRPTIVIATPVRSAAGEVRAIWAGALRLDELSRLGRGGSTSRGATGSGYVTDRRGLVIAHHTRPSYVENQTDFSSVPTIRAALAGQRGDLQFVNPIEGIETLAAYRRLDDLGWAVTYGVPVSVAFEPVRAMTRGITFTSALVTVAMAALGFLVAQRIARPLHRLTKAAATIGTGNFDQLIQVSTGDEIQSLAAEFNRMAKTLAAKERQLRRHTDDLQTANRELEAFSYSVSHDLRAPLRAMDGFSRILLEEEQSVLSEQGRRYLGLVRQNATQMGCLVDDLLAFSRLGRQPMTRVPVAPEPLIRQVLDQLTPERNGCPVEIECGPLPACEADPALLKQVWMNLLSNALKYTRGKDPARITIGASTVDAETVYFVADNGVGFDMRYAEKLFGVFQRLHRAEDYEGTGVGLAIAQRIVHRHGGRIWAVAEPGKGATFSFTLGPASDAGSGEAT